jgi:hypothetical protein
MQATNYDLGADARVDFADSMFCHCGGGDGDGGGSVSGGYIGAGVGGALGVAAGSVLGPKGMAALGTSFGAIGYDVGRSIGTDPHGGYGPGTGVSRGGPQP